MAKPAGFVGIEEAAGPAADDCDRGLGFRVSGLGV